MDQQNHQQELPSSEPARRLSDHEIDEKAAEAQALLDNPVFKSAINDVYSRALGTLLSADVGSLTASTAHATIKAIHDIRTQLENYITDNKMRKQRGR